MKTLLVLLLMFALTSCYKTHCPEADFLRAIEKEKYIENEYNCVDKSIKLTNHLVSKGHNAYVVVGEVFGLDKPHAWVLIFKNEETYYLDPTFKTGKDGLASIRYNKTRIIWLIFERGVVAKEVREYRRIMKIYKCNIKNKAKAAYLEQKKNSNKKILTLTKKKK